MPFTLAHPAAVLPLRKRLLLSALVIGSMAPDFHYFFYFAPDAEASHSLLGIVLCLPAGLALLWLFHRLLKRPVISLLPESHARKLMALSTPFPFLPASRFLLIVGSLVAGTLTHLLWDSFTHSGGWMVQNFPLLQTIVLTRTPFARPLCNVLQHASSILGMVAMALFYAIWRQRAPSQPLPPNMILGRRLKRGIVVAILASSLVLSVSYAWYRFLMYYRISYLLAGFAIAMITVTFVDLVIFSLWWWRRPSSTTTTY